MGEASLLVVHGGVTADGKNGDGPDASRERLGEMRSVV